MKASNKILLGISGFLIIYLITGLVALRNEALEMLSQAELENKYEAVPVDTFQGVDFSAHWDVNIKQGKEYKVELAASEKGELKPILENREGILYFTVEGYKEKETDEKINVKVTAPTLKEIKTVKGTKIHLANFTADSLNIILENGGEFTGDSNQLNYVSFKTSGDAWLQLTDNTDF